MRHSLLYALGIGISVLGCQRATSPIDQQNNEPMADSVRSANGSSLAAVEDLHDKDHRFIRTADLQFKVRNVEKATYSIEDIVARNGGFVNATHIESTIDQVTTTPVSADSSLEITHHSVTGEMTIRVPNVRLDTTLKDIAKLVDHLDHRIIKAEDITLALQANEMEQKRLADHRKRLADGIDRHGKKLGETASAEEALLNKQQQADEAFTENMGLLDQVRYSTVQLSLYQRQAIEEVLIANEKTIVAYQPGLSSRILDSLRSGLDVLETIMLTLIKLWWLILMGLIGWVAYKKLGMR